MNSVPTPHEKIQPYVDSLVKQGWRITVQNQDAVLLEGFPLYPLAVFWACVVVSIFGIVGIPISGFIVLTFIKEEHLRVFLTDYGDVWIKTLHSNRIDNKVTRPSHVSRFMVVQSRKPIFVIGIGIGILATVFWIALILQY